jgi:hypothetical protein
MSEMGEKDVALIADAAAQLAVERLFQRLGIRHDDVYEAQKDFAFLREWRQTCEMVRGKGTIALLTLVVSGFAALLLLGFRQWISGP